MAIEVLWSNWRLLQEKLKKLLKYLEENKVSWNILKKLKSPEATWRKFENFRNWSSWSNVKYLNKLKSPEVT